MLLFECQVKIEMAMNPITHPAIIRNTHHGAGSSKCSSHIVFTPDRIEGVLVRFAALFVTEADQDHALVVLEVSDSAVAVLAADFQGLLWLFAPDGEVFEPVSDLLVHFSLLSIQPMIANSLAEASKKRKQKNC